MARMKRSTYTVWCRELNPDGTPTGDEISHVVELEWADQLRGELEGGKYGIDTDAPLNLTTVWVWCAMVRNGLTKLPYPGWKSHELVGFEKLKEPNLATGELEAVPDVEIPPTGERSGSASDSLSPTPEPLSTGGLPQTTE